MQKAKADFLSAEANYKSLKSQLQILGINTEQIVKEDFAKEYQLIAPIGGTVSNMNGNTGKFVKSENCIYEIVNENILNVELNIFEKDIEKIKKNQGIIFRLSNGNEKYETKINRIGAKINQENRSVKVFGTFDNKLSMLKPGMHINASILLNELLVSVIPSSAVVDNEGNSYIFIKHKDSYKRVQINKGIEQNEYCQIKNITEEIKTSDIVINGSYYLMSAYELNE